MLQGGLVGIAQGDLHGDLKALPDMTQGDQGGFLNQINQLEKEKQILLEKLRLLESQKTVLEQGNNSAGKPSPASLNETEQGLQDSLTLKQQPSPEASLLEIDYSPYPHLTSNDIRAKQNRAERCKKLMLGCTNFQQLEQFKSESGFSHSEIEWVYHYLLCATELK